MADGIRFEIMLTEKFSEFLTESFVSAMHHIRDENTQEINGFLLFTPVSAEQSTSSITKEATSFKVHKRPPVNSNMLSKKPRSLNQASSSPIPISPPKPIGSKIDVSAMMIETKNHATNEVTYQCAFCKAEIKLLSSMKRHIETKHLPSSVVFKCRTCDYSTKYKHDLKKHYMTKHNMPEPAAQGMMMAMM